MSTKSPHMLFIDNDKFLLDMYIVKFSRNNFIVHASHASEHALKILRDGMEPDILLLELAMPGMNGLELLSIVREENLAKNSAIIILTNQELDNDIARARKLNVNGYIIKSMNTPSDVLSHVQNIYLSSFK